jgi:hypothetical protein
MTRKFVRFTEVSLHEGETAQSWILTDGNGAALDDLAAYIEDTDGQYVLDTDRELTEDQVDVLVEFGNDNDDRYLSQHTKYTGDIRFPDGFTVDDLYKGGISTLFGGRK